MQSNTYHDRLDMSGVISSIFKQFMIVIRLGDQTPLGHHMLGSGM